MTKQKKTGDVSELIRADELLTSSQIADRLTADGRTAVAARQQLARGARSKAFWRSTHLQLPHRERLFADRSFVGTPEFVAAVEKELATSRPALARCIGVLKRRHILLRPEVERLLVSRNRS